MEEVAMLKPKHTFQSVVIDLVQGLKAGTITLGGKDEPEGPRPFKLSYPLYAIKMDEGYHVIQDPEAEPPLFALVGFTTKQEAQIYMEARRIDGGLTVFNSSNAFWQFLQGVQQPVSEGAFDPRIVGDEAETEWHFSIPTLWPGSSRAVPG
jgi:hypothetical protein